MDILIKEICSDYVFSVMVNISCSIENNVKQTKFVDYSPMSIEIDNVKVIYVEELALE